MAMKNITVDKYFDKVSFSLLIVLNFTIAEKYEMLKILRK